MRLALLLVLLLAACGRPLAPPERAFLAAVSAPTPDLTRMRISGGFKPLVRNYPVPPRITCQSRLYPPTTRKTLRGASPGMTLFNTVFLRDNRYSHDLTGGAYPEVLDLEQAFLLIHEAVHVWQWQNRARTGYHPLKAGLEHVRSPDPYLFDPETEADFLGFGYEQQGAIVEEYLCCRLLAPDAPRTHRLHRMLAAVFPVSPLDRRLARKVLLPWNGVEIEGICA